MWHPEDNGGILQRLDCWWHIGPTRDFAALPPKLECITEQEEKVCFELQNNQTHTPKTESQTSLRTDLVAIEAPSE
jgi:hypothetical protein